MVGRGHANEEYSKDFRFVNRSGSGGSYDDGSQRQDRRVTCVIQRIKATSNVPASSRVAPGRPPSSPDLIVLVFGRPGDAEGATVEPPEGEAVADAGAATFVMVDEQMTRAPPPFVESLHWLMVTA